MWACVLIKEPRPFPCAGVKCFCQKVAVVFYFRKIFVWDLVVFLMKIIKLDSLSGRFGDSLADEVKRVVAHGGVVMHPTETCYGFAADIFNEEAMSRLYALKKMARSKPVSVMVRSFDEAKEYGDFSLGAAQGRGSVVALELAKEFWPGPLTLVLPRKENLPVFLNEGLETVGIRCPDFALCEFLVNVAGGPLSTTSANVSGVPEVYDVESYLEQVKGEILLPDLVLDGGKIPLNKPSTIIGFRDGFPVVLREGSLFEEVAGFMRRFC